MAGWFKLTGHDRSETGPVKGKLGLSGPVSKWAVRSITRNEHYADLNNGGNFLQQKRLIH